LAEEKIICKKLNFRILLKQLSEITTCSLEIAPLAAGLNFNI